MSTYPLPDGTKEPDVNGEEPLAKRARGDEDGNSYTRYKKDVMGVEDDSTRRLTDHEAMKAALADKEGGTVVVLCQSGGRLSGGCRGQGVMLTPVAPQPQPAMPKLPTACAGAGDVAFMPEGSCPFRQTDPDGDVKKLDGLEEKAPTPTVGGKKRAHDPFLPRRLAAASEYMNPEMNPDCDPKTARTMAALCMISDVAECKNCKSQGVDPIPSGIMMAKCKCGLYFG